MKCHVCGAEMYHTLTDMPFKLEERSIVIVKGLPVYQCKKCWQFSLADSVMKGIEGIVAKINTQAELVVIQYAA